jgi:hypothetical protein
MLSVGTLTAIPFAHAAGRLGRRALKISAIIYGLAGVLIFVIAAVTPETASGQPAGHAGRVLSVTVSLIALGAVGRCWLLPADRSPLRCV